MVELEGSIFDSHKPTSKKHALAASKTMVPCQPANFFCAGINYPAHIEWGNKRKGTNTKPPAKTDLEHGMVCDIIQDDIGVLRNPVARAKG